MIRTFHTRGIMNGDERCSIWRYLRVPSTKGFKHQSGAPRIGESANGNISRVVLDL